MDDATSKLGDEAATRALVDLARRLPAADGPGSDALAEALRDGPGIGPGPSATPGELARRALRVLAEIDPGREALAERARGPSLEFFEPATTLAVAAAALVVLQTRVGFRRDPDGRFQLDIEKAAMGDDALTALVEALRRWFSAGLP